MIIKNIIIAFAMAFICCAVDAKSLNKLEVQALADAYLKKYHITENISAVSITIYSKECNRFVSAYAGSLSHQHDIAINSESVFQIGSITKSFIAAIILKLEADPVNHFSIDDTVDKYFPEYPKWHAITIRQLMNMTSGIPDCFSDETILSDYSKDPYKQHDIKNWINHIHDKPLLFKPGAQFHYSNTNYFLLGLVIEKITRHGIDLAIKRYITQPLNLKHTFFISHQFKSSPDIPLVHGYQVEPSFSNFIPLGTDVTNFSMSYLYTAGGIISTSKDVAKWIHALFEPGKVLSKTELNKLISIVSEKNAQQMSTLSQSDPNGYGLGISVYLNTETRDIWFIYQGITFGFRAIYIYIPEKNILVSIIVNSGITKNNHLFRFAKNISNKLTL